MSRACWSFQESCSRRTAAAAGCLLLAGCAPLPTGPMVAVMPPPTKPFAVFMQEDALCREWAAHSIGLPGHEAAAQQVIGSTVAGAVIGGLAGAAVGGQVNAGTGAGMGTVVGAAVGVNRSASTAWHAQHAYDIAYQQCMYAKGNLLPNATYGSSYPPPGVQPPSASTSVPRAPAATPQR